MQKEPDSALKFPTMQRQLRRRQVLLFSVLLSAILGGSLLAHASKLSADEAAAGWIQLFDGETHFGWTSGGAWQIGGGAWISDPEQQCWLRTTSSFADFDLKFEARVTNGSAALMFRSDPQGKPAQPGYELSLKDGRIAEVEATAAAPLGNGWNSFEVLADGTHLIVSVNGRVTTDAKDARNRVGYFEFRSSRGSHLEVRSILLKPLGFNALYNGANLDGWRAVDAPTPQNKSRVKLPIPGLSGKPKPLRSVRWIGQGSIHGDGGVGELATTNAYDDFVLQFAARPASAPKEGPGIELFFRESPNQFGSGYAVDVDVPGNRQSHEQASSTTGSLVKLDKSRGVSLVPGQFYTCTVVARGHQFAIWINGVPVTDYYDSRPEGTYHAAAGALGFRIQDGKASLDVRDVKIATIPKGPEPPPPPVQVAAAPTNGPVSRQSAPAPAPIPVVLPGPSPQDNAQQEQIRRLTVQALAATSPEDAVQINKQILILDPGDMPAQQRLDRAQSEINAANADREHAAEQQQASASKVEANSARSASLVNQAQEELLHGDLYKARDEVNDAQRLGARGPEVDRLQALILSRLRNRLLIRLGVGGGILAICAYAIVALFRRHRRTMNLYLVALDGVDKGKRYLLNQEVTHMGGVAMDGTKKNEVLVRDPDRLVSRFHCEVHRRGNACYLIDLDSSNGTYLRRRPLPAGVAVKLRDGDQFSLARAVAFELRMDRHRGQ